MIKFATVTPAQGKIIMNKKRFRVVNAGRRFGKSFLAGYEMLIQATSKPNSVIWYVAPTLPQARKIMWNDWFRKNIPEEYIAKKNEQMMTLTFKNGSMIYVVSASDPDSLRGSGVDLVVFDEAAFMPNNTWEIVRPVLSDKYHAGKALFISTPAGFNWFYDMFQKCKENPETWESFQFTTLQGGNVTEEELEEARRTMSTKMFNQEYMASFETMSNRIYYNYDRELNVIDKKEDWWGVSGDIHVGIDFNVNPMTAAIAVKLQNKDNSETLIFFDEIVEPNSDTQDLSDKLNLKFPKCGIFVYPDPTCKKRQTNAMAGVTDLSILKKNGFTAIVPPHPYATKDKYNSVNTGLLNAKGDRHIFVVRDSCPKLCKAWEGYIYKENGDADKSGGLDHISDAAAYLINAVMPVMSHSAFSRPDLLGV